MESSRHYNFRKKAYKDPSYYANILHYNRKQTHEVNRTRNVVIDPPEDNDQRTEKQPTSKDNPIVID